MVWVSDEIDTSGESLEQKIRDLSPQQRFFHLISNPLNAAHSACQQYDSQGGPDLLRTIFESKTQFYKNLAQFEHDFFVLYRLFLAKDGSPKKETINVRAVVEKLFGFKERNWTNLEVMEELFLYYKTLRSD